MAERDIGSFPKVIFQKNIRVSIERGKGKTSKSRGKKFDESKLEICLTNIARNAD